MISTSSSTTTTGTGPREIRHAFILQHCIARIFLQHVLVFREQLALTLIVQVVRSHFAVCAGVSVDQRTWYGGGEPLNARSVTAQPAEAQGSGLRDQELEVAAHRQRTR
eukprot:6630288-Prymnesium_polylepis.1